MRSPEQEEELSQSKGALITRLDVQDFGSIEKAVKAGIYKVGKIVKYFASRLNMSLYYLSDLLKRHTGKTTLEHIHLQLVDNEFI